jgi:hypothetical protein
MAVTYAFTPDSGPAPAIRRGADGRRSAYGSITVAGTYVNPGGTAITSALEPRIIGSTAAAGTIDVEVLDASDSTGIVWRFDRATLKLKAYWSGGAAAALAEVTNGQALTGVFRVAISGQ